MKGFKDKSGKFRPTGNKSKSSLKKSDVVRKKKSIADTIDWKNDPRQKAIERLDLDIGILKDQKRTIEGNIDADKRHLSTRYYSDAEQESRDIIEERKSEEKRNKVSIQEGLHRPQRNDGVFTPLTELQKQENIDALVEDTDAIYIAMVEQFPNSSVGGDVNRWASEGSYGNHGHFGEALREGRIADAMYRADGDNLEHLGDLHIENLLSNVKPHELDPSERAEFLSRLEWARGRTQKQRDNPLAD